MFRRLLIIPLLILALSSGPALAAPGQPPLPTPDESGFVTPATPAPPEPPVLALTVREQIDQVLTNRLAKYVDFQAAYYAAHGRYYQARITHSTIPADGNLRAPDRLTDHPSDQLATGADMWSGSTLPGQSAFALQVDVYAGPNGSGHVLNLYLHEGGQLWHRAINIGPETWRGSGWSVVRDAE